MAWEGHPDLVRYDATRFLPDLTRVKSGHCPDGRARLPLGRRVPRQPRQARPDLQALSPAQPPLPCGLRLRALGRATLHWSVTLPVRVQGWSAQRDDPKRSL
jgi:hypothetical protein